MPTPVRSNRFAAIVLFALSSLTSIASCAGSAGCTLIGCADGIEVAVNDTGGVPVTAFHGTVVVNGTSIAITCDASSQGTGTFRCPVGTNGLVLSNVTATTIHVTLTADANGHAIDADVPVTTTTSQPNGPGCEPTCHQGRATATLM